MTRAIPFVKMSGTGNDFILVDNRGGALAEAEYAAFAKKYCHRRTGVGSDGVLLVENDAELAFRMRFINPDGSEASMCGNGARCIVVFARRLGIAPKDPVTFRAQAGPITAWQTGERVKLRMTDPSPVEVINNLDLPGGRRKVYFVNTGVPHAVMVMEKVDLADVAGLGAAIRYHGRFAPEGTNADFIEVMRPGHIRVRTYERGVEGETFACGTGAVASALVAAMASETPSPVIVHTFGGDELTIHFEGQAPQYTAAYLEGETETAFRGEIERNF
jgi:diaminopimelate epimerase